MVEIASKCALMMTAMVKPSAQIEPFQVSKGNEICFFFIFSVIFLKKRFFILLFAAVRDLPVLDIYGSLKTGIS